MIFADVRTYWSPDAVKRVTGHQLTGQAAGGILHLINSGPATLDGTGQQSRDGEPVMKPYLGDHARGSRGLSQGHHLARRPDRATSAAAAGRPASARAAACR